jgi:hypothetical protein
MNIVVIPKEYSKYGFYTSFLFLANSFVAALKGQMVLAGLLSLLFFAVAVNWSTMYLFSGVKMIDFILSFIVGVYTTFVTSYEFSAFWNRLWGEYMLIATIVFFLNTLVFYDELNKTNDMKAPNWILEWHVAVHIVFLHILPTLFCCCGLLTI